MLLPVAWLRCRFLVLQFGALEGMRVLSAFCPLPPQCRSRTPSPSVSATLTVTH